MLDQQVDSIDLSPAAFFSASTPSWGGGFNEQQKQYVKGDSHKYRMSAHWIKIVFQARELVWQSHSSLGNTRVPYDKSSCAVDKDEDHCGTGGQLIVTKELRLAPPFFFSSFLFFFFFSFPKAEINSLKPMMVCFQNLVEAMRSSDAPTDSFAKQMP